ncbi:MAG: arginine--tRNA ligase [Dissulfurispiraceae bacterium]
MERILRRILTGVGLDMLDSGFANIDIEIPKDEGFGDLSTPVAMGLARVLKQTPRKIAEDVIRRIPTGEVFEKIEIAGPGFINFTFTKKFLYGELRKLVEQKEVLIEDTGKGRRVQVEFVSANPTGPLHLGHGRGAALGAALSNLLSQSGYDIEREYYINDAGRQVKLLGHSVFAKYKQLFGLEHPLPEDGYRGDYIEDLAKELNILYGDRFVAKGFHESSSVFIDFSYKKMLQGIERDLRDFGVFFDSWQSERALFDSGEVMRAINDLKERNYIYLRDDATWFRSSALGDDKDRVIIKKDGEYTYFASDIAYHRKKIEKGYDEIINIWGADHHGYIPRMKAVIQAFGHPQDSLRVLLTQMVTLLRGGQPVQMSKRAGEFITLRELMDEIGPDTTKFLFLTRRPDSHLEIDVDIAKAQSQENPVFYVQYAHARINSILEKAREETLSGVRSETGGNQNLKEFNGQLFNEEEMRIIKKLLLYPMTFKNAALSREPHKITFYLQELAGLFHSYYHQHRVISEDAELARARLALCSAIMTVLRHGLKILGVKAPKEM